MERSSQACSLPLLTCSLPLLKQPRRAGPFEKGVAMTHRLSFFGLAPSLGLPLGIGESCRKWRNSTSARCYRPAPLPCAQGMHRHLWLPRDTGSLCSSWLWRRRRATAGAAGRQVIRTAAIRVSNRAPVVELCPASRALGQAYALFFGIPWDLASQEDAPPLVALGSGG